MGRQPRIDLAGFLHVVNRGIERNNLYKSDKDKTLEELFDKSKTKRQRNNAIINAIEDGYKQIEISKYLELSNSSNSKIVLERYKSGKSIHGT